MIGKNSGSNNKKNDKLRNKKDFRLSNAQYYANAIELTYIW